MKNQDVVNNITNKVMKLIYEGFHRAKNKFDVLSMLSEPVDFTEALSTSHWNKDRNTRSQKYNQEIQGEPAYSFIVDTGHPNGFEIHTITDEAFIVIQNENTKRIVTILAARPEQIKRYWKKINKTLPHDLNFRVIMDNAENNLEMGLNNL